MYDHIDILCENMTAFAREDNSFLVLIIDPNMKNLLLQHQKPLRFNFLLKYFPEINVYCTSFLHVTSMPFPLASV